MKLRILTDLHMEGFHFRYNFAGEDVVLLGGDIHTQNRLHTLLDYIPANIPVYFVAGNHEYYGMDFDTVNKYFGNLEIDYPNFTFMDNRNAFLPDGTPIFGGTMFTDFELNGVEEAWFVKKAAKECIADFYHIKTLGNHNEVRDWNPQDHINQHILFLGRFIPWLKGTEGRKRVVLTHFMPTPQLTHPRFQRSGLNPYFTVNMEEYMGWEGLWVCGHGHDQAAIKVGDTRIVMNPKGYGRENEFFNPELIVEI